MKVLISGAGIAGLTLAFWLQRDGNAVTIVEKSPSLRDEGYMMDFFGSGYDVAAKMDVLHELANIHYPISRLTFLDVNGREKFSVAYTDFRRLFGGHHFNFMRGDLERVLYSKIKDRLQLRFATTVESFEQKAGKVHAKFSDGSGGLFDLLVGADGVHSRIRRLAFAQEKNFSRFLEYYTAAFILDRQPHSLGIRDAFYTLATPERQVGAYPTRSGRLATLFVYKAQRRVNDFSFETAVEELRKVYGRMDWIVPELLDRCDRSSLYFDEVSQIEMPRWSQRHVVLVGDACHCVSLLAGQGASLAMAGAYVLAQQLAITGIHIGSALRAYEHAVKPAIEKKQAAGRRLARWFVPDNQTQLMIWDWVTRMVNWPAGRWLLKRLLAPESIIRS